jgi:hypothetical protein
MAGQKQANICRLATTWWQHTHATNDCEAQFFATACQQGLCMQQRWLLQPANLYKDAPTLGSRQRQRSLPGIPPVPVAHAESHERMGQMDRRAQSTHISLADNAADELALVAAGRRPQKVHPGGCNARMGTTECPISLLPCPICTHPCLPVVRAW